MMMRNYMAVITKDQVSQWASSGGLSVGTRTAFLVLGRKVPARPGKNMDTLDQLYFPGSCFTVSRGRGLAF